MRPPILDISKYFADAAKPAVFPMTVLRFRNNYWSQQLGLAHMNDTQWIKTFGHFEPIADNLASPLALRYHGHQFHVYNPELGDGRGFLFAQMQDPDGRWLDLGTKGSGTTRWSRQGDGRLTLKGGVREVLAATYLEALGVNTSKPFSLIETGEQLQRQDEPSPTRSSVLVRLSHSHLRFGSFQRAAYFEDREALAALVRHLTTYYYPECDDDHLAVSVPALFDRMIIDTARMIASWMAVGFVHGVMNTDNFNITGETFDFGPWRFLAHSDPNFTAAYFDHQGLYRFGRQPVQGVWALNQLAGALSLISDMPQTEKIEALYTDAYQKAFAAHTYAMLGLQQNQDLSKDLTFLKSLYNWLTFSQASWPQFFFDWFGGEASLHRAKESPQAALYNGADFLDVKNQLCKQTVCRPQRLSHPYFQQASPVDLLSETVEAIWHPIAEADDWQAFENQMAHMEQARRAYLG